jgi:hypothetical protein
VALPDGSLRLLDDLRDVRRASSLWDGLLDAVADSRFEEEAERLVFWMLVLAAKSWCSGRTRAQEMIALRKVRLLANGLQSALIEVPQLDVSSGALWTERDLEFSIGQLLRDGVTPRLEETVRSNAPTMRQLLERLELQARQLMETRSKMKAPRPNRKKGATTVLVHETCDYLHERLSGASLPKLARVANDVVGLVAPHGGDDHQAAALKYLSRRRSTRT